jgi:hypothetical protein
MSIGFSTLQCPIDDYSMAARRRYQSPFVEPWQERPISFISYQIPKDIPPIEASPAAPSWLLLANKPVVIARDYPTISTVSAHGTG